MRSSPAPGGRRLLRSVFSVTALGSVAVLMLSGVFGVLLNARISQERAPRPDAGLGSAAKRLASGGVPFVPCATPLDYSRAMPLQVTVTAVANWDGTQFRRGSRLGADVADSETLFPLADEGTGFVDSGSYRVKVGNEIVRVSGDDTPAALAVARSSVPERHFLGDAVAFCPERERLQRITLQVIESGSTYTAVVVKPGPLGAPTLTVPTATFDGAAGAATFSASVRLDRGENPSGALRFELFGPGTTDCSGEPVVQPPVTTVAGAGDYAVERWPVPAQAPAGEYRVRVTYDGDDANRAVRGTCDAGAQPLTLPSATGVTLVGAPSAAPVTVGDEVSDSVTLTGLVGVTPGGTVAFSLFGPDDPSCAGIPVAVSAAVPVTGDGTYGSGPFQVLAVGWHHWVVVYSGDTSNAPSSTGCGVDGRGVEVTAAPVLPATVDESGPTSPAAPVTFP